VASWGHQNAPNSFCAGAPPRTPLGRSRRSPRPTSRMGRGTPPSHTHPPRRLRRRDLGAFGASASTPSAPVGLPSDLFFVPARLLQINTFSQNHHHAFLKHVHTMAYHRIRNILLCITVAILRNWFPFHLCLSVQSISLLKMCRDCPSHR